MKLQVLELTEEDRAGLLKIVEKARDWRMRHRAQTLLYFGDGWRAKAIATQQNLHLDTVYDRRKHWLTDGFTSLADKHRCGAPSKVSVVQREQLRTWATQEALTARELLTLAKGRVRHRHASKHVECHSEADYVCVKTHASQLEKKRDELKFRAARAEIEDMLAAVDRGEIDLAYCDEAGFAQTHPNRSA